MNDFNTIYCLTNLINGKVYIGQTWLTLNKRWHLHCSKNSGCTKLASAIRKYGTDNFSKTVLCTTSCQLLADILEIYYIDLYKSVTYGYNLKFGGSRGKWTQQSKDKVSQSNMGHEVSLETRAKLSKAHKGKKLTEEHKRNLSLSHIGIKHNDSFKLKHKGENNGRAKLTKLQVEEITHLYNNNNMSSRKLAKQFGVTKSTILRIINNKSWI